MTQLYMEPRHVQIVKDILQKHPYIFYAYGSRVKGTQHKFSDLDLCYKDKIPGHIAATIKGEFEDSDLPFTVDLVYWEHFDNDFKKLIVKDLVKLDTGHNEK